MFKRHRRLRINPITRNLVRDNYLQKDNFIYPLFINTLKNNKTPISSMVGVSQFSGKYLLKEIEECMKLGLNKFILFGIPSQKDALGSDSWNNNGVIQTAIKDIKKHFPESYLISDICFCEYTDHGHCGVVDKNYFLRNDHTLKNLSLQTLSHATAGADMLAPSGMIDGTITTMRETLDKNGFEEIPILSYAVKFASNLYGPFRTAAECSLNTGDRKSHQMSYTNAHWDSISEAEADIEQGADIIMVKPALPNLDIIQILKQRIQVPIAAYQVSGEYAMLKNAVDSELLKPDVIEEILLSIKRAGAGIIISYFSKEMMHKL